VPPTPRRPTVLVVEDDPDLRALYRASLSVAGFAVIAAGNGIDALRQIDLGEPDLLVLDIGLPGLDGRDVQRELSAHADTRSIPIVVVTGGDTSELNEADFSCVLRKPIDPAELVSAVRRCLQKR
jgi:two-component system phosphate regulon response regulator PhoB